MNKFVKKTAEASAFIALLGAGIAVSANTSAVAEAASKYSIKTVKKAYIYTSKGKKTKKYFKKNTSLKTFGTKWIKGKKYYVLGKNRYIRTVNAKKPAKYSYSTQTRKITRTIKMYQPKGVKKVVQKAYIKRTVKTNLKSHKKTYGKWSTSAWKKYKVATVKGYTASRASVGAAKVTYKRKNQTIKITYKLVKKAAPKKTNKPASKPAKKTSKPSTKPATKPSTTPSKPANSGSSSASSKPATKPSQPASQPSKPTNGGTSSSNTGSSSSSGSSSSNTSNNGGMATQYKLETKDATITPGTSYDSTAFKVKYQSTGKSAPTDVIKSVSVDNKAPFSVSVGLEYGIYNLKASPAVGQSGTYNVPVTVTYTDGTKETVTIKITVPALNYWTEATKASARTKLLDVINGFRSAVGVSPVTLDTTPEYQNYLNQRATEKAKQYAETGVVDHSGETLLAHFKLSTKSDESIGQMALVASDSVEDQLNGYINYEQKSHQAEKDDYEAINIRHERNYLTNSSGTVLHYLSAINPEFSRVVIGNGTYSLGSKNYVVSVIAYTK